MHQEYIHPPVNPSAGVQLASNSWFKNTKTPWPLGQGKKHNIAAQKIERLCCVITSCVITETVVEAGSAVVLTSISSTESDHSAASMISLISASSKSGSHVVSSEVGRPSTTSLSRQMSVQRRPGEWIKWVMKTSC